MNEKYLQTKNDYLFMCGSGADDREKKPSTYKQKKQHDRLSDSEQRRDKPITYSKPLAKNQLTEEQKKQIAEQEGKDEFNRTILGIKKPLSKIEQLTKARKERLKETQKTQLHSTTQLYNDIEKEAIKQIQEEAAQKNAEFNKPKIIYLLNDTTPQRNNELTIHIKDLNFTQKTVSHIFSDSINTITSNVESVIQFYKLVLIAVNKTNRTTDKVQLTSDEICTYFRNPNILKISVIKNNNKWYSCDNRRLCMLKILFNLGIFDGKVSCKHINRCHHNCVSIRNDSELLITMGNQPGKHINDITRELKHRHRELFF